MNEITVRETKPDEDGIITRIEYHIDEDGREYKIKKKIRRQTVMRTFYNSVEDRKNNWVKFGLAAGDNNVTFVSPEEIFMVAPPTKEEIEKQKQSLKFTPPIRRPEETKKEEDYKKDYKKNYKEIDIISVKHIYEKNTLKVFGISNHTMEIELYELFSSFCCIKNISIPKDWKTKESKCFAYISFFSEEDKEICLEKINNLGFDHQLLRIEKI